VLYRKPPADDPLVCRTWAYLRIATAESRDQVLRVAADLGIDPIRAERDFIDLAESAVREDVSVALVARWVPL
jgi:hypothetical protein